MRAIVCPELVAGAVRVILDYLRRRIATGCDVRAVPRPQDFNFCCTRGLHQSERRAARSHLETSSKQTLNCAADVQEYGKGREQRPFLLCLAY
jgi:hypothetical protein